MFVSFLAAMLQEKSLPYQPGSHTVIRKHRTAQAETVTPSEAKSSHRSAEYCKRTPGAVDKEILDSNHRDPRALEDVRAKYKRWNLIFSV